MAKLNYNKLAHLVDKVKKGDSNAFSELYSQTYQKVYFFALSLTKNEASAQDVVQDSFIKVLKSINTLEDDKLFIAWLNRIVYNTSMKTLGKTSNENNISEEDMKMIPDENENSDPTVRFMKDERKRNVMSHINRLPEGLRAVIVMKYYEDLKDRDIAHALNIPVGTVKSRLNTAKRCLKESMSKEGE